jgi:membrane associated rhomboid family serine protease
LDWLPKLPIVSLLLAVAFVAVPYRLASDDGQSDVPFEAFREEARTFLVRNPQLEVDTLGALILDPTWLAEMRSAAANSESRVAIHLPARMLARSQARLDGLIANAYELRITADPAWRFGVLDARSPTRNYIVHAFVHENLASIILSVAVMLLVGIALELTWGSLIFSAFVIAVIPMTAQGYRLFDASSGIPWSGGAGLAGALLGAYFIRGLGGHFLIPGWILLPAWLGFESFVVRGFWIDDLGGFPWTTICAAVGIGGLAAGALRLTNFESNVESRAAKRASRGPNPVVARAARLRSDGDPHQAFDLIQAAWRDDPKNEEVTEAFFSIAVEVGQPEAAAEAIIPSLRNAIRSGDVSRAIGYWFPIAEKECDVSLEATVAVRLGEALLDAGHPKEALFTLRGALEVGVSAGQATRIVKVARDLDDGLARRAAAIALNDASLDPQIRVELEPVAAAIQSDSPPPEAHREAIEVPGMESRSQLDQRVQAEHQSIETTAFPIGTDSDIDSVDQGDLYESDSNEAALKAQALDAGTFSAENLSAESPTGEAAASSDASIVSDMNSDDVLSHWNERDPLAEKDAVDLSGDLDEDSADEALLNASALERQNDRFDFGLNLKGSDLLDPLDAEIDSDLTPMIDATDELTTPLVLSNADGDDQSTVVFDQPTTFLEPAESAGPVPNDSSIGKSAGSGSTSGSLLRSMKALDALPIATGDEWIEIDASPRGKSKVPFSRIQTIAMAAVGGLGNRPVLIVDIMLNGSDGVDEPMKLIRFRSDRFDPRGLEPDAANPLTALIAWVERLQRGSNAICLPSRSILAGEFARFDTLEAYEREVLMAAREDEG